MVYQIARMTYVNSMPTNADYREVGMLMLAPDSRVSNHMDPETKLVHTRLERWGKWARSDGSQVDWPAQTVLGRVIEEGANGASQTGRPPISLPPDIALTDAAIARLGAIDKGVIHAYYLRWEPPETLWRKCRGIRSLGNFRIVLKRARWRVAGFLDGATFVVNN